MEGVGHYYHSTRFASLARGPTRRVLEAYSSAHASGGFACILLWPVCGDESTTTLHATIIRFCSILNLMQPCESPKQAHPSSQVATPSRPAPTRGSAISSSFSSNINKPRASLLPPNTRYFFFSYFVPLSGRVFQGAPLVDFGIVSPACSAPADNKRPNPILLRHPAINAHPVLARPMFTPPTARTDTPYARQPATVFPPSTDL